MKDNMKNACVVAASASMAAVTQAMAATGLDMTDITDGGNNWIDQVAGNFGVMLVGIAIIFCGIMLLFGKLTLNRFALIIGGAALIFGAKKLATQFQAWMT